MTNQCICQINFVAVVVVVVLGYKIIIKIKSIVHSKKHVKLIIQ